MIVRMRSCAVQSEIMVKSKLLDYHAGPYARSVLTGPKLDPSCVGSSDAQCRPYVTVPE
jgi:hypothetical protein